MRQVLWEMEVVVLRVDTGWLTQRNSEMIKRLSSSLRDLTPTVYLILVRNSSTGVLNSAHTIKQLPRLSMSALKTVSLLEWKV
jgi:hypothetical protein